MPKFKLHEKLNIRTMNVTIPIIITKRIKVSDVDNENICFYMYHFEDSRDIKDKWTWDKVPEENLIDMKYEALKHK